jgi:hypothetical protein
MLWQADVTAISPRRRGKVAPGPGLKTGQGLDGATAADPGARHEREIEKGAGATAGTGLFLGIAVVAEQRIDIEPAHGGDPTSAPGPMHFDWRSAWSSGARLQFILARVEIPD